jgi:hypothetical protein
MNVVTDGCVMCREIKEVSKCFDCKMMYCEFCNPVREIQLQQPMAYNMSGQGNPVHAAPGTTRITYRCRRCEDVSKKRQLSV